MLKWFYLQIIYTGFQHDYIVVQNCGGLAEIRGPYLHLRMAINEVKKLAENCGNGWNKSNFFYLSDQYQKSESDAESETSSNRCFQLAKWGSDELLGDQATIAMFLYSNQNHPELKSQYPEWKDRIKQIAKVWKNLPNDKRQPYVQNARENRTASRMNKQVNTSIFFDTLMYILIYYLNLGRIISCNFDRSISILSIRILCTLIYHSFIIQQTKNYICMVVLLY